MIDINYEALEFKIANTVRAIEKKPHVRYIRYLMTKKYSPVVIKKELQKLGLSSSHEKQFIIYYLAVMDPIIKKYGLGDVYQEYKSKLLRDDNARNSFSSNLLKFRIAFHDSPDTQVRFLQFVSEIEVENCWGNEVMKYYGVVDNMPLDADGNRPMKGTAHKRSIERILTHPKRYLIDKLILENLPDGRIVEYVRKNLNEPIFIYDISYYKKVFFNMRSFTIEEKIKVLEIEQNSLRSSISALDNDESLDIGEKVTIQKQAKERVKEIEENIRTLNMFFSEAAIRQLEGESEDFEKLFLDIARRSYNRYVNLDEARDRDVVDPLLKTAKMMGYAFEKVQDIKVGKSTNGDNHSQAELVELYKQRVDEAYSEQNMKNVNEIGEALLGDVDKEEILGTEELNIMIDKYGEDGDGEEV